MIRATLTHIQKGKSLERQEMRALIHAIMQGRIVEDEVEALLRALHTRGETLEELVGAAQALRDLAVPLPAAPANALDTCGTGGDHAGTFNISTLAALVVAGGGVPVAKHGNRAATSRCGSADLLEALGVKLEISPQRMAHAVEQLGIGFLFARSCHPAMARVAPVRARIETPTLFNRLGPLTNPMRARRQLLGVADAALAQTMLDALEELGVASAWVVHSEDGLDEISSHARTIVHCLENGAQRSFAIEPGQIVPRAPLDALRGGDTATNTEIARRILAGEPGPRRDVVVLNAAAAFCVAGCCTNLEQGAARARESLDRGAARTILERWIAFCAAPESAA